MLKQISKNFFVFYFAFVLLIVNVIFLFQNEKPSTETFMPSARVKIMLSSDEGAVNKAKIVIPQQNIIVYSDKEGSSGVINLSEGLFSILVYAKNYIDTAVFYLELKQSEYREINVVLLKNDGSIPFVAYSEVPSDNTIKQLLDEYR